MLYFQSFSQKISQKITEWYNGSPAIDRPLGWLEWVHSCFASKKSLQNELWRAIEQRDPQKVSVALKKGAMASGPIPWNSDVKQCFLAFAVTLGQDEVVKLLLQHHYYSSHLGLRDEAYRAAVTQGRLTYIQWFLAKDTFVVDGYFQLSIKGLILKEKNILNWAICNKKNAYSREIIKFVLNKLEEHLEEGEFLTLKKEVMDNIISSNDIASLELMRHEIDMTASLKKMCWKEAKTKKFIDYLEGIGISDQCLSNYDLIADSDLLTFKTAQQDIQLFEYICKIISERTLTDLNSTGFKEKLIFILHEGINESACPAFLSRLGGAVLTYHTDFSSISKTTRSIPYLYRNIVKELLKKKHIGVLEFFVDYLTPEQLINTFVWQKSDNRYALSFPDTLSGNMKGFDFESFTLFLNKLASALINVRTERETALRDIQQIFDNYLTQKTEDIMVLANDERDGCYQDFFDFRERLFFSDEAIKGARNRIQKIFNQNKETTALLTDSARDKLTRIYNTLQPHK